MDAAQRLALEDAIRSAVGADLDELAGEVARLRRELLTVERLVGVGGQPLATRERRSRVLELRACGHSVRAIAQLLHTSRRTVTADLRAVGATAPAAVHGLDGRVTRPRHARPEAFSSGRARILGEP